MQHGLSWIVIDRGESTKKGRGIMEAMISETPQKNTVRAPPLACFLDFLFFGGCLFVKEPFAKEHLQTPDLCSGEGGEG